MMYFKPRGVRYVDMAKWVDDTIYTEWKDENKAFEYIYNLVAMLARRRKLYATDTKNYEDFVMYASTRVFLRLISPKQFGEDATLPKVKSCLNYIKKTLYPMRVAFEQSSYAQCLLPLDGDIESIGGASLKMRMQEDVDSLTLSDFNIYVDGIIRTIRTFLLQIPYKPNSVEWYNIYTSCLLSFLNSMVLPKESVERIKSCVSSGCIDSCTDREFKKNREKSVILYHLDESYRGYIQILTNELRKIVSKDLSSMIYTPPVNMRKFLMDEEENQ